MKSALLVVASAFCIAAPASAAGTATAGESFDGPIEAATWRLGIYDAIDSAGGSPGAFLHNPTFDAAVPSPVYVGPQPSPFFGDYRGRRVTSLGIDVNVYAATFGVDHTRAMALVLSSDLGTPEDPSDDCDAYFVSKKPLPQPGTGWRAYDFRVPSEATALPPGWALQGACGGLPANEAWNHVITNVTRVSFPFSPPGYFWFFQVWDVGLDSIRISFAQ